MTNTREQPPGDRQRSAAAPQGNKKRGRPSKYRPEFCADVVKHMRRGLSLEAFGGKVGVSKDTVYAWRDAHPDFRSAAEIGDAARRLYFERLNLAIIRGKKGGVPIAGIIFAMKNICGWRDRQEVEHKVDDAITVKFVDGWVAPNE